MKRGIITTGIPSTDWSVNANCLTWNPQRPDIPGGYSEEPQYSVVRIPSKLAESVAKKVGSVIYIRFKKNTLKGVYSRDEIQHYLAEEARRAKEKREKEREKS